jgi:hypothetical protein
MAYFSCLSNEQFLDCFVSYNRSSIASLYRLGFFQELVNFGTQYYCLSRRDAVTGARRGLASTYMELRLQKINLSEVNLHDRTLKYAREQFHILKKQEQAEEKRLKHEEQELSRFLHGDSATEP